MLLRQLRPLRRHRVLAVPCGQVRFHGPAVVVPHVHHGHLHLVGRAVGMQRVRRGVPLPGRLRVVDVHRVRAGLLLQPLHGPGHHRGVHVVRAGHLPGQGRGRRLPQLPDLQLDAGPDGPDRVRVPGQPHHRPRRQLLPGLGVGHSGQRGGVDAAGGGVERVLQAALQDGHEAVGPQVRLQPQDRGGLHGGGGLHAAAAGHGRGHSLHGGRGRGFEPRADGERHAAAAQRRLLVPHLAGLRLLAHVHGDAQLPGLDPRQLRPPPQLDPGRRFRRVPRRVHVRLRLLRRAGPVRLPRRRRLPQGRLRRALAPVRRRRGRPSALFTKDATPAPCLLRRAPGRGLRLAPARGRLRRARATC
mmetsp:Transcript_27063/g.71332  ORF Transcript_27063/g.71332 Transcript_27063/m.71332 type:complete len:358 (-) Transcript_27063:104-1177(-)